MDWLIDWLVLNANFSNISAILWRFHDRIISLPSNILLCNNFQFYLICRSYIVGNPRLITLWLLCQLTLGWWVQRHWSVISCGLPTMLVIYFWRSFNWKSVTFWCQKLKLITSLFLSNNPLQNCCYES